MAQYYCKYRVGTNVPSNEQFCTVNASSQAGAKKIVEARYSGTKIFWNTSPSSGSKPPSWYKG